MTDPVAGAPLETLQKQLKTCWSQGCTDLGALVGQPLKFRSEGIEEMESSLLGTAIPAGSLIAPLTLEGEPSIELEVAFTPNLAIVLAGVLNVQRAEEIAARVRTGLLEESDRTAVGELANILASAFEEPLKTALGRPLHVARGELRTVEERVDAWQAADPPGSVLQRLTLSVAGMGDGEILLVLPVDMATELAGGSLTAIAGESGDGTETAGVTPVAPVARARRAPAPARRPQGDPSPGLEAGTPRVLVAGPVAQDTSEIEELFVLQGTDVVVCPRLRDIGSRFDPMEFTLVVLATPPGSLSALPFIRDLAALPGGPAVAVATRSATPSLVFQSVRAGADYVVVLPASDAAGDRLVELSQQPRRAAAA